MTCPPSRSDVRAHSTIAHRPARVSTERCAYSIHGDAPPGDNIPRGQGERTGLPGRCCPDWTANQPLARHTVSAHAELAGTPNPYVTAAGSGRSIANNPKKK